MLTVETDPERHEVILVGAEGKYEARLSWAAALNLGGLIQEKAMEIEPSAPSGHCYEPKQGRWG